MHIFLALEIKPVYNIACNCKMTLQNIQEDLVKLFLRLNGYFTTGLVIHSPNYGNNQTELDTLAIRLPFHNQPDRVIECSEYLQIPNGTIDIIIGEVKSGTEAIQINSALRNDRNSIEKLLNWLGAFDGDEITAVIDNLQAAMATEEINTPDNFKCLSIQNKSGNYSIRPIVFSVDRPQPRRNQSRFVYGQLMLDYIWNCLRPETVRPTCSTIYNLNMWGHSMLPLIEYFKDEKKTSAGNMKDLYKHFGFE